MTSLLLLTANAPSALSTHIVKVMQSLQITKQSLLWIVSNTHVLTSQSSREAVPPAIFDPRPVPKLLYLSYKTQCQQAVRSLIY